MKVNHKLGWRVYSKSGCKYCAELKDAVKEHKVVARYMNCDENPSLVLDALEPFTGGHRTFPVVFKDRRFIGGYDDFIAYWQDSDTKRQ